MASKSNELSHDGYSVVWLAAILRSLLAKLRTAIKVFKFYGYILLFGALLVFGTTLLIPIVLLRPFSVSNMTLAANLLKHITRPLGISWELRGGAVLRQEKDRIAIVVANHQCILDILGFLQIWHALGKCSLTSKAEAFYYWPIGLCGWLAGHVFLDRKNPADAQRMLDKAMRDGKKKLWVFPEGTRNRTSATLLPFKKGAFRVAIASQVPILPVVFSPYHFFDERKHEFRRGHVVIQALEAIPTAGLTMVDLDDLVEGTRLAMQTAYDALSVEVAQASQSRSNSPQCAQ